MNPDTSQVEALLDHLRQLPWGAHALVAGVLVAGLIVWLFGVRVLKPGMVVCGCLIGAAAGFLITPLTPLAQSVSPHVGLAVGALLGLLAGLAAYRFAMAFSLAMVVGVAAPVAVATWVHVPGQAPARALTQDEMFLPGVARESAPPASNPTASRGEAIERFVSDRIVRQGLHSLKSAAAIDTPGPAPDSANPPGPSTWGKANPLDTQKVRSFLIAAADELELAWDAAPPRKRLLVSAAGVGGFTFGWLLGLLLPASTAALVSSAFGAALWLPALVWMGQALQAPGRTFLAQRSPLEWLITWGVVAFVGAFVQWSGLTGRKKKPAAAPAEA